MVEFYITANRYPDGRVAEVFLTMDQTGSTLDGFADAWATAVSLYLQCGGGLGTLARKFSFQEFAPSGMSKEPDLGRARSVVDYTVRWLEREFKPKLRGDEDETERVQTGQPAADEAGGHDG